jgi:hypothetical protein
MALQISSNTVIDNTRKGTFLSMNLGVYTTATRPSSPTSGDMIFNSDTGNIEVFDGTNWK